MAPGWAGEQRVDPVKGFDRGAGGRCSYLPSGFHLREPVHFPGILQPEELLEELLLLLRELGGGLEVHDHHQIAGGFAPQAGQTQARKAQGGPGLRVPGGMARRTGAVRVGTSTSVPSAASTKETVAR